MIVYDGLTARRRRKFWRFGVAQNAIFLAKTVFLERFSTEKQQNREKSDTFLRNPPLVADRGVTRGGFLKKGGFLKLNTPDIKI